MSVCAARKLAARGGWATFGTGTMADTRRQGGKALEGALRGAPHKGGPKAELQWLVVRGQLLGR